MGFRFRKSVRILPGVRLNFSKSGTSVSIGTRGLRYTVGTKGTRTTVGLPGTGISWTEHRPYKASKHILHKPTASQPIPHRVTTEQKIESASAETINALSISELAPILAAIQKRPRFTPAVVAICSLILLVALALNTSTLPSISLLFAIISIFISALLDRYRRSIKVEYTVEGTAQIISKTLAETFLDIRSCKATWAIATIASTSDWKRNAGASKLNEREAIYLQFGKPTCLRGDISLPTIKTAKQEIYFLPDALLLRTQGSVAALTYQELSFENARVNFIEEKTTPPDAVILGNTWRFINKDGSPDRRFNGNRQIPICQYGQMSFRSANGLNCIVQYSRHAAAERFAKAINILQRPSSRIEAKSITSAKTPKAWPGNLFLICFSIVSLFLFVLLMQESSLNIEDESARRITPSSSPSRTNHTSKMGIPGENQGRSTISPPTRSQATPKLTTEPPEVRKKTLAECLTISDLDARTDCFEEVHANFPRQ
ncbi:MAG: DUF4236 domain-containing protein [Xanthobacteraceae bacterium]|uniref:DUF4236 domain-containing protein n=1 Tax=Pseudolabrys sp. TaxID=1960880 RepID=UPI003D0FE954